MTFVIAVAGKGGVGKSTISTLLIKCLAEKTKSPILAVDADPNSTLGELLGTKVEKTIGDLREDFLKQAEQVSAADKHELIRYHIKMAMVEGEKFDLLTMGRPEGRGCYCYINNILRAFLDEIMNDYQFVVIDNEAGMEHLSRRTCRRMDMLMVVSDPTRIGIETATRILNLAKSMDIEMRSNILVVNRVQDPMNRDIKSLMEQAPFDRYAFVPYDQELIDLSGQGEPVLSLSDRNNAYLSVKQIVNVLGRTGSI